MEIRVCAGMHFYLFLNHRSDGLVAQGCEKNIRAEGGRVKFDATHDSLSSQIPGAVIRYAPPITNCLAEHVSRLK